MVAEFTSNTLLTPFGILFHLLTKDPTGEKFLYGYPSLEWIKENAERQNPVIYTLCLGRTILIWRKFGTMNIRVELDMTKLEYGCSSYITPNGCLYYDNDLILVENKQPGTTVESLSSGEEPIFICAGANEIPVIRDHTILWGEL